MEQGSSWDDGVVTGGTLFANPLSLAAARLVLEEVLGNSEYEHAAALGRAHRTLAVTNATLPFIVRLVSSGVQAAIRVHHGLTKGVNVIAGRVACRGVAEAHGMPFQPLTP